MHSSRYPQQAKQGFDSHAWGGTLSATAGVTAAWPPPENEVAVVAEPGVVLPGVARPHIAAVEVTVLQIQCTLDSAPLQGQQHSAF
jgi:hypothetical protein